MKIIYEGVFFDAEDLAGAIDGVRISPLAKNIERPHVTFKYKPTEPKFHLYGEKVVVEAIGYGYNDENEGVLVRILEATPDVLAAYEGAEKMHITLSVSETGKAVNTKDLEFKPITPVRLEGEFGPFGFGLK